MRLSPNEEFVAFCSNDGLSLYHLAQFFNERSPNPYWIIEMKSGERVLKMDWNQNHLFVITDAADPSSASDCIRTVKHYQLSESLHRTPNLIGSLPNLKGMATDIALRNDDILSLSFSNGLVSVYRVVKSSNARYELLHSLDIGKELNNNVTPFSINWIESSNQICAIYGVPRPDSKEYQPHFLILEYGQTMQTAKCIESALLAFDTMTLGQMVRRPRSLIEMLHIPQLDYLLFCCRYIKRAVTGRMLAKNQRIRVFGAPNPKRSEYSAGMAGPAFDGDDASLSYSNICGMALDVTNQVPTCDPKTGQWTLPPVPLILTASNKLNIDFNGIGPDVPDSEWNYTQSLPMMKSAARSLPPIPERIVTAHVLAPELLNKFRTLYRGYFHRLYHKYAPDKVQKVDTIMKKYGNTLAQLQATYDRATRKYQVKEHDIERKVTVNEMKAMDITEDGRIVRHQRAPQTPPQANTLFGAENGINEFGNSLDDLANDREPSPAISNNLLSSFQGVADSQNMATNVTTNNRDRMADAPSSSTNRADPPSAVNPKAMAFGSDVFDNAPADKPRYQFYEAFKQIHCEMEQLCVDAAKFEGQMMDTQRRVKGQILESGEQLKKLVIDLGKEKGKNNANESKLHSVSLCEKVRKMRAEVTSLQTKLQKLSDPTYARAVKKRGVNEEEEKRLESMHCESQKVLTKISKLNAFRSDEHRVNGQVSTPHDVYKTCVSVEKQVRDRYSKYLNLAQEYAPHLLMEGLNLDDAKTNTRQRSQGQRVESSKLMTDCSPKNPEMAALAQRHKSLIKSRRYRSGRRAQSARQRRNGIQRRNIHRYMTPQTSPTRAVPVIVSGLAVPANDNPPTKAFSRISVSPLRDSASYLQRAKKEKQQDSALDVSSFTTKIQHTPCKSTKTTCALKRRASGTISAPFSSQSTSAHIALSQQKATPLRFDNVSGIGTIRRSDRRRAARAILEATPYKPPSKRADQTIQKPIHSLSNTAALTSSSTLLITPKKKKSVPVESPMAPKAAPALEPVGAVPDEKEEKQSNQWGGGWNNNAEEKKEEQSTSNLFGSLSFGDAARETIIGTPATKKDNNAKSLNTGSGWGQPANPQTPSPQQNEQSAADIYKQRLTAIYNAEGQQHKLPKLLGQIEDHRQDPNWMHSLYVKVCGKYNRNPEPMAAGSSQQTQGQTQQQSSQPNGSWSSWGSSSQSGFGNSNQSGFGNSNHSGFGSMGHWADSPSKQQQSNQSSNIWGNQSGSSWNWGGGNGNNGGNNTSNGGGGGGGISFASNANSGPSWATQTPFGGNAAANNDAAASDPFAAMANSTSGGFGSLLS